RRCVTLIQGIDAKDNDYGMNPSPGVSLDQVLRLARDRQWQTAHELCGKFILQYPESAAGWSTASQIALALDLAHEALNAIRRAIQIDPANRRFWIQCAHCLLKL